MREGETDFKGKFWAGQHVKVALHKIDGITKKNVACDTGVITKILVSFVRSPDLKTIRYNIRFDKPALKTYLIQNIAQLEVKGELLESVE